MRILILLVIAGTLNASTLGEYLQSMNIYSLQEEQNSQQLAYEQAEKESLDRIIEKRIELEGTSPSKIRAVFRNGINILCLDIPSYQDKEKVYDLLSNVCYTKISFVVDSNRILIKQIDNPTTKDRLRVIEALTKAPLSSHFPYPKFVELCLNFKSSAYSYSKLILALTHVEQKLWPDLCMKAEKFGSYKPHVSYILAHILPEKWERSTRFLSSNSSCLKMKNLNDLIKVLNGHENQIIAFFDQLNVAE